MHHMIMLHWRSCAELNLLIVPWKKVVKYICNRMGHTNKTYYKMASLLEVACITVFCVNSFANALNCPQTVYAELGKDVVIDCKILQIGDVYWYIGKSTDTSPIVQLENGLKRILRGNRHYNITDNGSLVVNDLDEQYYGFYSVLNFHADDTYDADESKLEIAVKPQMPCPVISGCNSCDDCLFTKSEKGNLTCSIIGSRPQVDINMLINSQNGFNVLHNASNITYDEVADTWNTSLTVKYEWHVCDSSIQFSCRPTEDVQPFRLFDSFATIQSAQCVMTTGYQTPSYDQTKNKIGIVIITCTAFGLIALGFGIFMWRRRVSLSRKRKCEAIQMVAESSLLSANSQDISELLTDHLATEFEGFQSFSSSLNGKTLSSDDFFVGTYFSLIEGNGNPTTLSCPDLVPKICEKGGRCVFIAPDNFWRQAFLGYLCSRLSEMKLHYEIFLYLNLKGLHGNMSIADAINEKMKFKKHASIAIIKRVMKTRKCLFLLDEVHELMSQEKTTIAPKNKISDDVSINDLISESYLFERYKKLGCLLLFDDTPYTKAPFNSHFVVRFLQFSKELLKEYVTNKIDYCLKFPEESVSTSKDTKVRANDEFYNEASKEKKTKRIEAVMYAINHMLEEKNEKNNIDMSASLLQLFAHVLVLEAAENVAKLDDFELCINRRSYLVSLILCCLEFLYIRYNGTKDDFENLKIKLGSASLTSKWEKTACKETSHFISTYNRNELENAIGKFDLAAALSIGLLKFAKGHNSSNNTETNTCPTTQNIKIVCCHNYIEEHLAAQVIRSDNDILEKLLRSQCWSKDERMGRVLHFIYGTMSEKGRKEIFSYLVTNQNWNALVDCLFESESYKDVYWMKDESLPHVHFMNFIDLDNQYHRMAILRYCENLVNCNVSITALSFREHFSLEFFSRLKIPTVLFLVFMEMDLIDETHFTALLYAVSFMDIKNGIQFVKCKCPDQISEQGTELILQGTKYPKIFRTDEDQSSFSDPSTYHFPRGWTQLNITKRCWEWQQ